ncbi:hypothetical protein D3C71_1728040 [compost metagenome]
MDDARHDELLAEQDGRSDGQVTLGRGVDAGGGFVGLVDAGEDMPGVFQVAATGFGQAYATGGAQQQLDPQLIFQGADGTGDRGWGDVQAAGSSGEAFQLAYGDEHLHQVDLVHAGS